LREIFAFPSASGVVGSISGMLGVLGRHFMKICAGQSEVASELTNGSKVKMTWNECTSWKKTAELVPLHCHQKGVED
jgi:hypothetical protein